jgi:ATP-binding cassette subfamily B protein
MKLPWKGGRLALVASAAEDRRLRFFLCCLATMGTVGFSFLNPQIIRFTIDSVIGNSPIEAPAFVKIMVERLGGVFFSPSEYLDLRPLYFVDGFVFRAFQLAKAFYRH